MIKNYKLNKYLFILVMTVLIASVRYVSAEDCPCSPCPGGVYGCEDGCISICYPDTNQCYASCTKGKSLETLPSIKFDKKITLRKVYINNVPSGSVKPILEKIFNVKLAGKSEAKTNLIKIRADNVDLGGILVALEKQGLVLKLQQESEYLSPDERQRILQRLDNATEDPAIEDRLEAVEQSVNAIVEMLNKKQTKSDKGCRLVKECCNITCCRWGPPGNGGSAVCLEPCCGYYCWRLRCD